MITNSGLKKQHSTDMCIFKLKSVIKYYTRQSTPVFSCLLDAAKAFDRGITGNYLACLSYEKFH